MLSLSLSQLELNFIYFTAIDKYSSTTYINIFRWYGI